MHDVSVEARAEKAEARVRALEKELHALTHPKKEKVCVTVQDGPWHHPDTWKDGRIPNESGSVTVIVNHKVTMWCP